LRFRPAVPGGRRLPVSPEVRSAIRTPERVVFVSVGKMVGYDRSRGPRALTHALPSRFAAGSGPRGMLRRATAPSSANHTAPRRQFITGSGQLAQSVRFRGPTVPVLSTSGDKGIMRKGRFLRAASGAKNSPADSWSGRRNSPPGTVRRTADEAGQPGPRRGAPLLPHS
jgi:hypothetical protein